MSSPVRIRAHAKINLALRVGKPGGKPGEDGFHPIATVFQTVSLCDLLYAEVVDSAGAPGRVVPAYIYSRRCMSKLRVARLEMSVSSSITNTSLSTGPFNS